MDVCKQMNGVIKAVRLVAGFLLLLCLMLPVEIEAQGARVVVLADPMKPVHAEFLAAFRSQLGGDTTVVVTDANNNTPVLKSASVIVTLGYKSAQYVSGIGLGVPTVHCLVTKSDAEQLQEDHITAANEIYIYLEQPPSRTLLLIQKTLPWRKNITFAVSASSKSAWEDYARACKKKKMNCEAVVVTKKNDINKAFVRAEETDKVLVLLPDPNVVNSVTARNLILSAYRRNVALVGYSMALVKAGALMAVHSTPEQMGEDAASVTNRFLKRKSSSTFPASGYSRRFSVSVNYQLARALDLHLEAENSIHDKIDRAEQDD